MLKTIKNTIKGMLCLIIPTAAILIVGFVVSTLPLITIILVLLVAGYFIGKDLDKKN